MNREKIKILDPIVITEVAHRLPCYADSLVQNRYHSASSKKIAAWLRFTRKRQDGLFDCLHFARDYYDGEGFLYSAEGYLSFFSELHYPSGPFGYYCSLQNAALEGDISGEDPHLGQFMGGSWFLLGGDVESARKRLATVLDCFRDFVLPQLDTAAEALLQDPMLRRALELIESLDVGADDARDHLTSELRAFGEEDRRGYPAGKIAAQLVWKKRGNKNWHQL